jgi:DNA-binding winged helix-turn-helix (wHTH) protein/tetratricopeptide (TPR) repeat protein
MKASATHNSSAPETSYRFGLYVLDPSDGTLTRDSVRVRVQEQPFQLLLLLVERAGQIVSREEIRNRLWPQNTFVEFDRSLGVAVLKVREALGDDASNPRFIETIPRRGYRFIAPIQIESPVSANPARPSTRNKKRLVWIALLGSLLAISAALGAWIIRLRSRIPEHAAIVIGNFANETGDQVFDGSLRRAVMIHLAQSPYVTVVPDQKLGMALQNIGRSPEEALTPALALQVCQRLKSAALVTGLIRGSTQHYQVSLEVQNCADGTSLVHEAFTVDGKPEVLPRLSTAVDDLRKRLGESRQSLKIFDVSIEQATTTSLEALRAYQLGMELRSHSKNVEARDVLKTAIALDPDFAIAYAQLGSTYSNLGEPSHAKQYFEKAFALRARATEPERLYITGRYFDIVTGEREKGSENSKLWLEIYPNDWKAYNALANNAVLLGRYQTAVDNARKAMDLGPSQDFGSSNLLMGLMGLNRMDEAKDLCEKLLSTGHDNSFIHLDLFGIAYFENDQPALERQREWAKKHPNDVGMIFAEGSAAASEGRLENATKQFDQVAELDIANGDSEAAAITLAVSAEINSEMGRTSIARKESGRALKLGRNEMVYGLTGLVASRGNEVQRAQLLLNQMDHEHPLATFNLGIYSPILRTMVALSRGTSPEEVSHLMEPALPYEFGSLADMLPIYVRGTAYLAANAPAQAEAEFQKIIRNRNIDPLTTLYPLSVLGMARCYRMMGKMVESETAYRQLFTLWKNADKSLPLLLKARDEFERIRKSKRGDLGEPTKPR